MKYLILIITILSLNVSAQTYKQRLAAYRERYKADFLSDAHSPLKQEDLNNLNFYDADSTYKVSADVQLTPGEIPFQMPTFSGTAQTYVRFAKAKFNLQGKAYELNLYRSIALMQTPALANYLFSPFTDDTNGSETYQGGRYIDMQTTDIRNGKMEIDFNKAYNPYCAYSAGYQCPIPPRENFLPLKITAGEKLYTGEKKHR
ncbi:DUF1684 domain-containing protein [Mucilaginibacter sp. 21P]|uniref:DUF1684 domain-containing protein n=1 Tax=Mucilaginibacter sp. 21P TaxID=2778902 RepID=UPI001C58096A|nr:DUF1684 domain-containing protein [Mucilaginibacter sp. 21P]QXV66944.1 DUF1684 domain-containing protein [Mucilaginibacter sp. 21P]